MSDNVELAPYGGRGKPLAGFVVAGRWPDTTHEWAQMLQLIVRLAAVPGMLRTTSVFHTTAERPDSAGAIENPVGLVVLDGPVVGDAAPAPGSLGSPLPFAALLLHPAASPAAEDRHASGCVFLPGLPHLGLGHRAAWVSAQANGTVTRLVSADDVTPQTDPDTAVLAMLMAA